MATNQHIFDSVKASLKRLQLDYIDVLQCRPSPVPVLTDTDFLPLLLVGHRFDDTTPFEETASTFAVLLSPCLIKFALIDARTP